MATVLFCRGRDNPYSNEFALIALQIVVSNLMAFLSQLVVVLPEILQTAENLYAVTICDFYYCTRKFLAWKLSWEENCLKSNGAGETWWRIRYFWTLLIPNAMFALYVAIFHTIRRRRQNLFVSFLHNSY
ncbi:hypothetical protein DINM_007229 [Dirofilaria immitis]|nr:hypothetical protein [Dirofilaria immitis]